MFHKCLSSMSRNYRGPVVMYDSSILRIYELWENIIGEKIRLDVRWIWRACAICQEDRIRMGFRVVKHTLRQIYHFRILSSIRSRVCVLWKKTLSQKYAREKRRAWNFNRRSMYIFWSHRPVDLIPTSQIYREELRTHRDGSCSPSEDFFPHKVAE